MSIILSDISYHYYNQKPLFESLNLSVATGKKISVIGNNGVGKTTLLKLVAKEIFPSEGSIRCSSQPYYIPQQIRMTDKNICQVLGIVEKIEALRAIDKGSEDQRYYDVLIDNWDIEFRIQAALDFWDLSHFDLSTSIDLLSRGEKTKLFLAGISLHKPTHILLDEPTNHLDATTRQKLYEFIQNSKATMMVISHDLALLNLLDTTYELSPHELKRYGGNYDFYLEQKEIETGAMDRQIHSEQKNLKIAYKKDREMKERQEKRFRQGKRNKDGVPRIMQKGLKDNSEKTSSKLKEMHSNIIARAHQKLHGLKQQQSVPCELKLNFGDAQLHTGKLLITANKVNYEYIKGNPLWQIPFDLEIRSGERIYIKGDNGTGKTTLIKLLIGTLLPSSGKITKNDFSFIYLDQEYSQTNTSETVLELAQKYNFLKLPDDKIKLRLHRALFPKDMWNKSCYTLSCGERMRLYLCCLMIFNHIPDLFILDEPTNNIDLSGLNILTNILKEYQGTLLIISHDQEFINKIGITKRIELKSSQNRI